MRRCLPATLAAVLLTGLVGGCGDFSQKYPTFPAWGWWNSEPKPAPGPAIVPEGLGGADQPDAWTDPDATAAPDAPRPTSQPAPRELTRAEIEQRILERDNHRIDVYSRIEPLWKADTPDAKRQAVRVEALAKMDAWYRPLALDPPDTKTEDWVTILSWDFMPDEKFERTVDGWRKSARQQGWGFPAHPTRREMIGIVERMLAGQAPTDAAPATP